MSRLIAISPIGKNGQTVVPGAIRKMFKTTPEHNLVGFYIEGNHVQIAPVSIHKEKMDYTHFELSKIEKLSKQKNGKKFKTAAAAKKYIETI